MNIFDNMSDETPQDFSTPPEGTFVLQYAAEFVRMSVGGAASVKEAFIKQSEALGLDPSRSISIRDDGNNLLSGREAPQDGRTYMAAITHDEKGS